MEQFELLLPIHKPCGPGCNNIRCCIIKPPSCCKYEGYSSDMPSMVGQIKSEIHYWRIKNRRNMAKSAFVKTISSPHGKDRWVIPPPTNGI